MPTGVKLKGFINPAGVLTKAILAPKLDGPTHQEDSVIPDRMTTAVREMFTKKKEKPIEKSTEPLVKTVTFGIEPPVKEVVSKKAKPAKEVEVSKEVSKEVTKAKAKRQDKVLIKEYDETLDKLRDMIIEEEEKDPYDSEAHVYVPETRRGFANFIKFQYSDYELKPISEQIPTPIGEKFPYQKFIREYMRQASPYRGVLVYHGLGSGKTCTAIAASEALFSSATKKIIVMTPKSLRKTFLKEITLCGFRHFRLQNYWVSLDKTDNTIRTFATSVLNIPDAHLKKAKHIWVPDFDQPSNYDTLSSDEQTEIREQILSILVYDEKTNPDGRIRFIHYNGISAAKLKNIACNDPTYFDDAVVIVDEIHNLIRLMQGKIESYLVAKPKVKRKVQLETVGVEHWNPSLCDSSIKYARGYSFYRLLLAAKNTKIIGLSGTPLINFPEELGILANVLHGYIPIVEGVISSKPGKTEESITRILSDFDYSDFVRVEPDAAGGGIKFIISLLPEGIKKISNDTGVERIEEGIEVPSREQIVEELVELFKENRFNFSTSPTLLAIPLLPAFGEEFSQSFLNMNRTSLTNTVVLAKRLSGLISYYKGAREDRMPKVIRDEVLRIPMSEYQQKIYMLERGIEIKKDKGKTKNKGPKLDVWTEISDIANMKNTTNYRMTSRQICNFAFPPSIKRPRAITKKEQDVEGTDVKEITDAAYVYDEQFEETLEIPEEEGEEGEEEEEEGEEEEGEEEDEEGEEEGEEAEEAEAISKQQGGQPKTMKEAMEARKAAQVEQFIRDCKDGQRKGEDYKDAILRAKKCLAKNPELLDMNDGLRILSPKFVKMLQNIKNAPGSSLVYSQFLDMEGIGIFRIVMDANGYAPIEILSSSKGFKFSDQTIQSFQTNQPRYITFSGAEEEDIRRLALNIFNAELNQLPENISKVLYDAGFEDNKQGQICRVFCITSAGAEGLSLKNVRAVHIMEPYWNDVRLKQVKGRAIRIGSHLDLPLKERNVSIYTYISVFGSEAQKAKLGPMKIDETIVISDSIERKEAVESHIPLPEGELRTYTLTSDERLFVISERKKTVINELEKIMKSASVDCDLNYAENKDGSYICLKLEGKVGDYLYHPLLYRDIAESESKHKIVEIVEKKVVIPVTYKGIAYSAIAKDGKYTLYARDNFEKPVGELLSKNGKPALPIRFY